MTNESHFKERVVLIFSHTFHNFLQEYNDLKVVNDAFQEEIICLHKEQEELMETVESMGLKPKLSPLPDVEQNVIGLSGQLDIVEDVKPKLKEVSSSVPYTGQSEESLCRGNKSKDGGGLTIQSKDSDTRPSQSQTSNKAISQSKDGYNSTPLAADDKGKVIEQEMY